MATSKSSAPITVRLPNEIIQLVEAEAAGLGMSRSEVVARRLAISFAADEVRKTDKLNRISDQEDQLILEEESE